MRWIITILILLAIGAIDPASGQDRKSPFGRRRTPTRKSPKKAEKEYEDRIAQSPPSTATEHLELARWCDEEGLKTQARTHYEEALKLNGSLEEAREALGWKKVNGAWESPEAGEEREKRKRAAASAHGIEVELACAADLTEDRLKEMADLFAGFNDDIWVCTRGNFYLKSISAADRSKEGNVRVGAEDIDKNFIKGGGITYNKDSPNAYMQVAGKCSVFTFIHEGGHLFFGLPDEYLNRPPGCPECVMVGGNMQGFGPGKWKFCDPRNHEARGEDCWTRIKKKFPKARYPNPDYDAECPFDCVVRINNTGR